jgi:hypothetical protein
MTGPYRALNTFHLDYKTNQFFYVSDTRRCLFQANKKHINTARAERTVIEFWTVGASRNQ